MAKNSTYTSFNDIVPHTFATVLIGEGNESIAFINRMDNKDIGNSNLHLTNLSVNQIDVKTIRYDFSVQYHPSTFAQADVLKLERIVSTIASNEANDDNNIIKIKFGYISGCPYSRGVRNQSYTYVGIILEMKTSVQQNYIEYSFTATGVYKEAENITLSSELRFSPTDHITKWIKTKLFNAAGPNTNKGGLLWGSYFKALSNSSTSSKVSKTAKRKFNFKCDCEIPSILELSGLQQLCSDYDLDIEDISKSIKLDTLLDFSDYDPKNEVSVSQNSLLFPANFNLISILKGICNIINQLCATTRITAGSAKHLFKHQFAIVYDSYIMGNSDNTGNVYGTIYLTDITNISNKPAFNYVFNYGFINKGDEFIDHTVISWDCNYNATAVIHDSVISNELSVTQTMDNSGSTHAVTGNSTPLEGKVTHVSNNFENQLGADRNQAEINQTWAYPYEATLTVLGNPEPIEICRKVIQVVPMINNSIHHTAGFYLVTSVHHEINSSMQFTTTYGLIRLDNEHAELFKSGASQDDIDSLLESVKTNKQLLRELYNKSL